MATPGTYTEFVEQYELVKNEQGISCTRAFHDDPTGNGKDYNGTTCSLPDVGDVLDPSDDELKTVIVTEVTKKHFGQLPTVFIYTIKYTNRPTTAQAYPMPTHEPKYLPISGTLGGEFLGIEGNLTGSSYLFEAIAPAAAQPVNQQIPKKIMTMSTRVTKRVAHLPLKVLAGYVGKINSEKLALAEMDLDAGTVLLEGIGWEEYYNQKGKRRWKLEFSLSIKIVPLTGSTTGGWQYILNEKTGNFERPYIAGTPVKYLYETVDFNTMFALAAMKENP